MIMSDRDVYAGAHVTPEVKDGLRALAALQNKSMSAVIYEAIKEKLEKEGIKIEKPISSEQEPALPFVH